MMRLYLKNIGKLKEADIKLEGITVVAGENNSGKSTVGKALYAVYNTFYGFEEKLEDNIKTFREKLSEETYPEICFPYQDKEYIAQTDALSRLTMHIEIRISLYEKLLDQLNPDLSLKERLEIAERLADIDSITNTEFAVHYFSLLVAEEFIGQVSNIFSHEKSILKLTDETKLPSQTVEYVVVDNTITRCEGFHNFFSESIYIDNPYVLDEFFIDEPNSHRKSLKKHLKTSPDKSQAIEQILAEKKLKNVLSLLNSVCEGELSFQNTVTYRLGKTGKSLDIKNLSTGLKSFAILKTLLLNGSLARGSVLILDEPEIHLHPEWQLVYAELIVLLQKEFKLTILLTTHSPYFLRALEVYAGVYKISDKCNYYFAKNEGQEAMIYDVTEDMEQIYEKLALPFQVLENLEWRDD